MVDGFELSYGFKEPAQFAAARRLVYTDVLPIVGAREAYGRRLRLAFGLWLDYDWRRLGWHNHRLVDNYFPPESFGRAAAAAKFAADEHVWVYSERVRWWTSAGSDPQVPAAYRTKLAQSEERSTSQTAPP